MQTWALSIHASYKCQDSGICCAAPWRIPAEPHVLEFVGKAAFPSASANAGAFVRERTDDGGTGVMVAKQGDGDCVFHGGGRCALHDHGGTPALPHSCRHFPRLLRIDARGIALTLSHFCPTAASLLDVSEPITIVAAEPPLAITEPLEGLDARDALPPLLRPDLLMDPESYDAWERQAVGLFSTAANPDTALAALRAMTERLRGSDLEFCGNDRFRAHPHTIDEDWRRLSDEADPRVHKALANYLAARTFGNWIAYQGRGLRTVVAWLQTCYDHARQDILHRCAARPGPPTIADAIEGIRRADYIALHATDSLDFGRAAAALER